jgi:hypothetical protein
MNLVTNLFLRVVNLNGTSFQLFFGFGSPLKHGFSDILGPQISKSQLHMLFSFHPYTTMFCKFAGWFIKPRSTSSHGWNANSGFEKHSKIISKNV